MDTPTPLVNPSGHDAEFHTDDELEKEHGISNEDLNAPKNVGVMVFQAPCMSREEAVENGILLIMVEDEPHLEQRCPEGPHEHAHKSLASGRLSYNKAMNLAAALVTLAAQVSPLDKTEEQIVERINKRVAEAIAADNERGVEDVHERGPYSVL